MEHLKIKDLKNGYFRVTAKKGYKLRNIVTGLIHDEAEVKNPNMFEGVK